MTLPERRENAVREMELLYLQKHAEDPVDSTPFDDAVLDALRALREKWCKPAAEAPAAETPTRQKPPATVRVIADTFEQARYYVRAVLDLDPRSALRYVAQAHDLEGLPVGTPVAAYGPMQRESTTALLLMARRRGYALERIP